MKRKFRNSSAFSFSPSSRLGLVRRKSPSWVCSTTANASERCAIIVGAGVAGLSAAKRLADAGVSVRLYEASNDVGGRIRTDEVDGFLLDRGFQVFIEGYPNLAASVDYKELDLQRFLPGAVVRTGSQFYTVSDPIRAPLLAAPGLFSPIGNILDKLLVLSLRFRLLGKSLEDVKNENVDVELETHLLNVGFSKSFISLFFRPFYQGIFLAPLGQQSAAMFSFVFRMFSAAPVSLPARGIGALTQQMKENLPDDLVRIYLNSPVESIEGTGISLDDREGTKVKGDVVIIATEGPEAKRLLGNAGVKGSSRGSICLYFRKEGSAPLQKRLLVLNGDEGGVVNNMFFPSVIAPQYAPEGQTLISTTIVGDELGKSDADLENLVREHMSTWYGEQEVSEWKLLKMYRIPHSQTPQNADYNFKLDPWVRDGVLVCGDHRSSPTVDGAIASGLEAAEKAIATLTT